jgi:molecular chaperone DnaJ
LSKRDYYQVLEVGRSASPEEIKKSFRRLARLYHPDFNKEEPDAEQNFKEVSEAYEVLSDPQKRDQYDRFGHQAFNGHNGGFNQGDFSGFGFGNISDIFENFFGGFGGGGRRRPGPEQGAHLRFDMEITLEEAYQGGVKTIQVPRTENCPECKGSRARSGTRPETCPTCGGSGQQQFTRNTAFGRFVNVQSCSTCGGEGRVIREPCPACRAQGRVVRERKIDVKLPPGVEHGSKLRIAGGGEVGQRGGPSGDLYVVINIRSHKQFQRERDDLIYELPLDMVQAALGDEVDVPTLDGPAKVKVPEGTQPDTIFRLKGRGMPRLRGSGKGDLHVRVKVVVPRRLSHKQRQLLEQFSKLSEEKGFINKVKDALGGSN